MIRFTVGILICGAILFIGLELLYDIVPFDNDPNTSFLIIGDVEMSRFILLLVSTYIGLTFEVLLSNVRKQAEFNLLQTFNSKDFFIAALVSPLVVMGAYFTVRHQPDGVIAAFVSFQNAFFWKTIINTSRLGIDEK
ncbi:hypothetical protein CEQ90_19870 [Lewinellaceae bacterium SD302]|nr:hypothetical protein CEQ90_19870 [Lewinellaceae bacterium SD302]